MIYQIHIALGQLLTITRSLTSRRVLGMMMMMVMMQTARLRLLIANLVRYNKFFFARHLPLSTHVECNYIYDK
jgi:hypothetical protein